VPTACVGQPVCPVRPARATRGRALCSSLRAWTHIPSSWWPLRCGPTSVPLQWRLAPFYLRRRLRGPRGCGVIEPGRALGHRYGCNGDASGGGPGGNSGRRPRYARSRAPTQCALCRSRPRHRGASRRRSADWQTAAAHGKRRASHAFRDHAFRDYTLRDPTLRDYTLRDPTLRDGTLRDRTLHDRTLHDPPPHTTRCARASSGKGSPPAVACLVRRANRPRAQFELRPRGARSGSSGPGTLRRAILLGTARSLPGLTCSSRELASPFGLAFGLFEAFARALELILRDAYALLGDLGLQSHPLERFGRGTVVAACLLHLGPGKAKGAKSHTRSRGFPPRVVIHRICA